MKIILTETLDKLGKVGQIVTVKDGFARNYLIPRKFAIIASPNNLKKIANIEAEARAKADRKNEEYRQMAKKIESFEAVFERRADADGHLFGSVSDVDIQHFLAENEVICNKNQINLEKAIKTLGGFEVQVIFTNEITALLKLKVVDIQEHENNETVENNEENDDNN